MEQIKKSYCAGTYYSENKTNLLNQIKSLRKNNIRDYEYASRLFIIPQSGYSMSGQCASNAYQYMNRHVKNVFIFGVSHNHVLLSSCIPNYIQFETPFYNLYVNKRISNELANEFGCKIDDIPFENEHSCEIQFPFLQFYLNRPQIIPILVAENSRSIVEKILDKYYKDTENAFIFSVDFYRGFDEKECEISDMNTAFTLENKVMNYLGTSNNTALLGLLDFITKRGFNLLRVNLTKSSTEFEKQKKFVGFGSFILIEEDLRVFFKEKFRRKLLDIVEFVAKRTIEGFNEVNIESLLPLPEALNVVMSSFISVELLGKMRGCIGTAIPYQPLLLDLIKNANLCMRDMRFEPLPLKDFSRAVFRIELIGDFKRIECNSQNELLEKIRPDIDGVMIKDGEHSALFLPSVWKKFPSKDKFVKMLNTQALLPESHFSETYEAYSFTVVEIV